MSATVVLDRATVTLPAKVPCIASASTPSGGPVSLRHALVLGGKGTEPENLCGGILADSAAQISPVAEMCVLQIWYASRARSQP